MNMVFGVAHSWWGQSGGESRRTRYSVNVITAIWRSVMSIRGITGQSDAWDRNVEDDINEYIKLSE